LAGHNFKSLFEAILNKIENNFVANPYKFKIVEVAVGIPDIPYGKVNL